MDKLDNFHLASKTIEKTLFDGCPRRNPKDFIFIQALGEGAFSTVYRAKELQSGAEFAVKVLNKEHVERWDKTEAVIREKNILNYLTQMCGSCPFVSRLYTSFQDISRFYLVMDMADGGDLAKAIKHFGSFDPPTTKFYVAEILTALDYIHHHNIIHRDLKPENVLIKADGHVMISDFGSAQSYQDLCLPEIGFGEEDTGSYKSSDDESPETSTRKHSDEATEEEVQPGGRRTTFVGTAQYVSPEMLNDGDVGPHSDLWPLGCILYQCLSGQTPFRAVNHYHLLKKIQELDFTFPAGFPESAADIVTSLLVPDPMDRIDSDDIKDSEFFDDIDWDNLEFMEPPTPHAYLPATFGEPEFHSTIEPGFDDKAQVRLMNFDMTAEFEEMLSTLSEDTLDGLDEQSSNGDVSNGKHADVKKEDTASVSSSGEIPAKRSNKRQLDEMPDGLPRSLSDSRSVTMSRQVRLERQKEENPYDIFCNGELILKQGILEKKRGLFARKRMFVLTEGPHLLYIDPSNMELKGEIPWTPCMQVEVKNFGTFFIHTPNRVYYLFDEKRNAVIWAQAIENTKNRYKKEIEQTYETAMKEGTFSEIYGKKKSKKEIIRAEKALRRKLKKQEKKREKMLAQKQKRSSQ